MKIFFISTMGASAWGGSEELWARTALRLKQQGHEIQATICSIQNPERPPRIKQLIDAGVTIKVASSKMVGLTILRDFALRRLKKIPGISKLGDKTSRWLTSNRPDLIVFSDGGNSGNLAWFETAISHRIPYVTIAQAVNDTAWPDDEIARRQRDMMENSRKCFFVSQANLETTRLQAGVTADNCEVVRNPFNVEYGTQLPWPIETGIFRMAFVGRLEPGAKGCDLLLRAMAGPQWKDRDVELNFFGSGASAQGVKRMAELLSSYHCHFKGHVADMAEVWREHHMLVLPSRYEGLPLAVAEAMLIGRPCLVTDVSGNAELIEDNVTGFVAEGASATSLSKTLERAWQRRNDWQDMGSKAAKSVRLQIPADPVGEFAARITQIVSVNRN